MGKNLKLVIVFMLSLMIFTGTTVYAATPPANAEIGNQASLEYVDGLGENRIVLSNIVITTVNPVYGVELTPDILLQGKTNENVYYVHTLTNLGNIEDSFDLTIVEDDARYDSIALFIPASGGGISPITEPVTLKAGETQTIIAMAKTLESGEGTIGTFKINANSEGGTNVADQATDELVLTIGPVINTYKSFDKTEGLAGEEVTAVFNIINTGGETGKDYILTDVLDSRFNFITGSAYIDIDNTGWQQVSPGGTVGGVTFNIIGQTVTLTAPAGIAEQVSGTPLADANLKLMFKIKTNDDLLTQTIPNYATYDYSSLADVAVTNVRTNLVSYTIKQIAGVSFSGETKPIVEQGALVKFTNIITNDGNGDDTFDVELINKEFPNGTDYFLAFEVKGQGEDQQEFAVRIPLIDTTGSGIVDTGIMTPGESKEIILWVQLPRESTGSDFKVTKLGTSTFDIDNDAEEPAEAKALDQVLTINPVEVDITNDFSLEEKPNNAPGKGSGPEVSPVTEIDILPGKTGYFNLYINNTSEFLTDEYTLEVSTDSKFNEITLPEGIEVVFEDAGGSQIKGTGAIAPNDNFNVRAKVLVASNSLAGNVSLFFRAKSQATGAYDIKHDMIKIGILRQLSILPNNAGATYAGSSIYYTHTITNGGNVLEGGGTDSSVAVIKLSDTIGRRFSSTAWLDTDNNGVLEKGTDIQITDLATIGGLAPGKSIQIFIEVVAAQNAEVGQANTTNVRLDVTKGIYNVFHPDVKAEDVTTIIKDAIEITKYQGLSTGGSSPENPADFTMSQQKADPEDYIYYKIIIKNTGTTDVTDVKIEDIIPQYTTMQYGKNPDTAGLNSKPSWRYGTESEDWTFAETIPKEGERGIIQAVIGGLKAGETAELYFNVKVDGSKTAVTP